MKKKQIMYWVLVFIWMGLIFYLSHQPAQASSSLSGGLMDFFISLLPKRFDFNLNLLHTIIRKCAHFGAYFILAILSIHAIRLSSLSLTSNLYRYLIALGICVLYAIGDEVHQLFIPGRSGQFSDVLLDSAGAIIGLAMYGFVGKWYYHQKNKR